MKQAQQRRGRLALLLLVGPLLFAPARAAAEILEFEDLFGPCGDYDLVRGPGSVEIDGVLFTSPDIYTYNVGKENSYPPGLGNPFDSDSYHFFTFGDGAPIDFPVAIASLRFITGERTNMSDWPTFQMIADGSVVAEFGANIWTPEIVDVTFPHPVTRVVIRFVQGSSSILGVDTFTYTPATSAAPAPSSTAGRPILGPVGPNPVMETREIVLSLRLPGAAAVRLDLFDPTGRRLASREPLLCGAGANRIAWTLPDLAPGSYRIRAEAGGWTQSRAFVLLR